MKMNLIKNISVGIKEKIMTLGISDKQQNDNIRYYDKSNSRNSNTNLKLYKACSR